MPSSLRSFAASAAAAMSPSRKPGELASWSSTTTAPALVAASTLSMNCVVQRRLFLVERRAASSLSASRELRAGAHERRGGSARPGTCACGVEAERVALVVERLHAREELRVEVDRVLVRRELRRDVGLDLLERVVRVRLGEVEEDLGHARQELRPSAPSRRSCCRRSAAPGCRRSRRSRRAAASCPPRWPACSRVLDPVERRRLIEERARRRERVGRRKLCRKRRGRGDRRERRGDERETNGHPHRFPFSGMAARRRATAYPY